MIGLPLLFALLLQTPPPSGSIEGFVVRAGTASPVVLVNARLELEGPFGKAVSRTDSAGHFAFTGLPAGSYRLRITKDGYVRQEYRQVGLDKPGAPLSLKAGQRLDSIVFRMEPAPTIVGMVRESNETRALGFVVQALKRGFDARGNPSLRLMASTVTDDLGQYRLIWLDPGEYFVSATPPPPMLSQPPPPLINIQNIVAYIPTYFPGFLELDAAKPVRLEYGRDAVGIDFRSYRSGAMSVNGYVTSMQQGPVSTTLFFVPPEDTTGVARYAGKSAAPSGSYGISGVVPGSYIVSATLGNETGNMRVRLKSNPNPARVDLRIGPGITVPGRIVSDTPVDLKNLRIHLSEMDPALPAAAPGTMTATGEFAVPAVQPGSYIVQVEGLVNDQYLKSALSGSADALENPISVAYPAAPELRIQIASDGGRITGAVYDRNDALIPNSEVILVPTSVNRFRFDRYRTAVTGDDGQFSMRGIAPGDYKLFAWENLEPNAHLNVDFMRAYESMGMPVHIEPNGSGAVSLRLIPGS
jgi:uncharacterized protein (DUF2141 family)